MKRKNRLVFKLFVFLLLIAFNSNKAFASYEVNDRVLSGKVYFESGMPCENREQFERWYKEYEQETSEETADRPYESTTIDETEFETCSESLSEEEDDIKVETDVLDSRVPEVVSPSYSCPLYTVNGELIDPIIQQKLHDALEKHGIGYWYEIGLCQIWQESQGDVYVINQINHEDMGLLQYKINFWDWSRGDIFDPDVQLDLYAEQMAQRLNSGLSADECISRHNTSDFVAAVNWEYVGQVKQWLPTVEKIEE